jgi:ABC-type amino acid transport substrate-binding protein
MKRYPWGGLVMGLLFASVAHADLSELRQRGVLTFGVYKEYPPFYQDGAGIDVGMAEALAQKLGMRAEIRAYDAGENMDDDLRVMLWKGVPTAIGPAPVDVMLHVPVDPRFAARNTKVSIFAPYYRETMAIIRNADKIPVLDRFDVLEGEAVGVEADSIADMVLMSYDGGGLRNTVRHYLHLDTVGLELGTSAIVAFYGTRSQVEPMARKLGEPFSMSAPPAAPGLVGGGWSQGLAVKQENTELAQALEAAALDLDRDGTLDRIFGAYGVTRLHPDE